MIQPPVHAGRGACSLLKSRGAVGVSRCWESEKEGKAVLKEKEVVQGAGSVRS